MPKSYINQNDRCSRAKLRIIENRNGIEASSKQAKKVLKSHQALIALYFDRGATCREIAALTGKSQSQIYRTIKLIIRKFDAYQSPKFISYWQSLSEDEKPIVQSRLFDGLTLKKTAALHGCTVYKVRKILSKSKEK